MKHRITTFTFVYSKVTQEGLDQTLAVSLAHISDTNVLSPDLTLKGLSSAGKRVVIY